MSAIVLKADALDIAGELPQLFRLAEALKMAGGFLPRHIRNEGEVVAVVLAGRELGLAPMVSLRSIYLVEGKVTLAADVQLALMMRTGATYQWLSDGRNGTAQLKLQRPGQPAHIQTFTIEDARQAGLTGKDVWKKYPAAMLRARCVSGAGKAAFPDVLAGVYLREELDDVTDAEFEAIEAPAARLAADAPTRDATAPSHEPRRDEYGLAIPSTPCPIVTKEGPNKGKPWSDLKGPLLEKMYADAGRMTAVQVEWCEYLLARRQARKAREAAEKERASQLEAMADPNADGGGYLEGDEATGDPEPPASSEAAQ